MRYSWCLYRSTSAGKMTKRRVSTTYVCAACGKTQTVYIRPTWVTCHDRRHKPTAMVVVAEVPLDAARPSN